MDFFLNFGKMDYFKRLKSEGCILCDIADKKPQETDLKVAESAYFMACVNLYPYNPGHLMIFPKAHKEDVRLLSSQETQDLSVFQKKILDALDRLYHPSAYNIGCNMGLDAGASITHLHFHIIPRFPHELGFSDLLSGKKTLVESPFETQKKMKEYLGHMESP